MTGGGGVATIRRCRAIQPPVIPAMPLLDLWFYAVAVPAVLIVGISKGGFGAGLGVVAVPLMTLAVPAVQAAAILLPVLCLSDLFGVWAYRRQWSRAELVMLIPPALAGIVVGALTASYVHDREIRLIVGLIAIVFTLNWLRGGIRPRAARPASPVRAAFWSALSGYTSFVAHAGGPPLAVYLLPRQLSPAIYTGTTVIFFAVVNYIKLIPYAWLGQFSSENLWTALVLIPAAPVGTYIGIWLQRRLNPTWFYRLCYGITFLVGIKLLADAAIG
ncbi:MAG: sulfite exporter TauE/SafE family protein [Ferrovibrionaceae bacterium]